MGQKEQQYAEKTAKFLQTFLKKEGYILLKTEYVCENGLDYLRVYIDLSDEERQRRKAVKRAECTEHDGTAEDEPGVAAESESAETEPGIGINDCAAVSRRLSRWLDQKDFIDREYTLEVCSRGYLIQEENSCPDGCGSGDNRQIEGEQQ